MIKFKLSKLLEMIGQLIAPKVPFNEYVAEISVQAVSLRTAFSAISVLSPNDQREIIQLMIAKYEKRYTLNPSEEESEILTFLRILVEMPVEEMAKFIMGLKDTKDEKIKRVRKI